VLGSAGAGAVGLDAEVDVALIPALPSGPSDDEGAALLEELLAAGAAEMHFQPIVHLASGETVGFEALLRGPAGGPVGSPLPLLAAARDAGKLAELDALCRASALDAAARSGLPDTLTWFLNMEPEAAVRFEPPTEPTAGLRVVVEVVERELGAHLPGVLGAVHRARTAGWSVAIDDIGAQRDPLVIAALTCADVLKLDMSLVQQPVGTRETYLLAAIRAYAERSGSVVLAEGVETKQQQSWAKLVGATYAQGHLYGSPGPLPRHVAAPSEPLPTGRSAVGQDVARGSMWTFGPTPVRPVPVVLPVGSPAASGR